MTLGWSSERVAEIKSTIRDGSIETQIRASGYRITETTVLTSTHAVRNASEIAIRFFDGTETQPTNKEWTTISEDPIVLGHDITIICIKSKNKEKEKLFNTPNYGRITPGLINPEAYSIGFPRGQTRPSGRKKENQDLVYRESKQASGHINPASGLKTGTWEMAITNRLPGADEDDKSSWAGMSGASVWVNNQIVGVVTQDVHPDIANTFTVTPLTLLWTKPNPLTKIPLEVLLGCLHPAEWDNLAVAPPLQKVLSDHNAKARRISPVGGAKDRHRELADMTSFCRKKSGLNYWWWRAAPWHGKTALMSTFAAYAPPDLWIASFFLDAQIENRRNSTNFLQSIIPQLDAIAGRTRPSQMTDGAEEESFQRILKETANICLENDSNLVIVIDALDEEDWHPVLHSRPSIPSLLPADPIDGLRIIISSRSNPDFTKYIKGEHQLKNESVRYILEESNYATEIREKALESLKRLDIANNLEWQAICLIAIAGSGLSVNEIVDIIDETITAVEFSATQSSLLEEQTRHFPGDKPETIYTLAHTTLPGYVEEILGTKRAFNYQNKIVEWCDRYNNYGWPSTTPRFLLTGGYTNFLFHNRDLHRITNLATCKQRQKQIFELAGNLVQVYEDIRLAEQFNLESNIPDTHLALKLCIDRSSIEKFTSFLPAEIPAIYAMVADDDLAYSFTKSFSSSFQRDYALKLMSNAYAYNYNIKEALDAARLIKSHDDQHSALMRIAHIESELGIDTLSTLNEALTASNEIANIDKRIDSRIEISYAQATGGYFDDARRTAQSIPDPLQLSEVLCDICIMQAKSGQLTKALNSFGNIPNSLAKNAALCEIAVIASCQGDDSGLIFCKALEVARSLSISGLSDIAYIKIAESQAAIKDYKGAYHTTWLISEVSLSNRAFVEIVSAQLAAREFEAAYDTAWQIRDPSLRIKSLSEIARCRHDAGLDNKFVLIEALSATQKLQSQPSKLVAALTDIAVAQAKTGHDPRQTFQMALVVSPDLLSRSEVHIGPSLYVTAMINIANCQAEAGLDSTLTFESAIDTISKLLPGGRKDDFITDLALAQAKILNFEAALETAFKCTNSKDRSRALAKIAIAQAEAKEFQGALVTSSDISDIEVKVRTDVKIAIAQAEANDFQGAHTTARKIPHTQGRSHALMEIAIAEAAAGLDPRPTIKETIFEVRRFYGDDNHQRTSINLAIAFAGVKDFEAALSNAGKISDLQDKGRVMLRIASAQVELCEFDAAISIADDIVNPQMRNRALYEIAIGQVEAKKFQDALSSIKKLPYAQDRSRALVRLVIAHANAGDFVKAWDLASKVGYTACVIDAILGIAKALSVAGGDSRNAFQEAFGVARGLRSQSSEYVRVLIKIAIAQNTAGYDSRAVFKEALSAAQKLSNYPTEHVKILTEIAIAQNTAGYDSRAVFKEALSAAQKLSNYPTEHVKILTEIAIAQTRVGHDPSSVIEGALHVLESPSSSIDFVRASLRIAVALGVSGRDPNGPLVECLSIADRMVNSWDRGQALVEIAETQITLGYFDMARITSQGISSLEDRTRILINIAISEARAGQIYDATIQEVLAVSESIGIHSRNTILADIVLTLLHLDDYSGAISVVGLVSDRGVGRNQWRKILHECIRVNDYSCKASLISKSFQHLSWEDVIDIVAVVDSGIDSTLRSLSHESSVFE